MKPQRRALPPVVAHLGLVRPMRAALFIIPALAVSVAVAQDAPSTFIAKAPSGRFTITQRWLRPDWIAANTDCNDADCGWEATLEFADRSMPQATLAAQPEWYSWPADYHISPDEHWVLRDQKTGSGENALFLYHVLPGGQVWRLSQHVDDLVGELCSRLCTALATITITSRSSSHRGISLPAECT